jgi:UDP-GlcNAc:undecaprenyl-phosphate/decaprenyl-phosphate GlcNAc-1-phosphate transferase
VPVWLLAFGVAVALTAVITPLSRRLALATDLVDKPGQHKSHVRPTPYLGGVGLIASVLVALALDGRADPRVAAVALGAAVIGAVGLLDDDRTVDPRIRFAVELGVAAVVTAFGLRIHATGIFAIDVALTLLWLVGVTNAFNLLDNMDGLAAGVAAAAAAAVFALAIMGPQPLVATVAAAVVGACLAFLGFNRPPASIFMGDAGSLFLGFVLAVLTISVNPALDPPFSFAVPLVLLALPVLDTSTVTLARLRRGLKVSLGGKDHLSHRLVALGLSRGRAVATLVMVEAGLSLLAVLAGRRVLQLRWLVVAAGVVLGLLAAVTARASVYTQPVVGLPRRLRLGALALAAGAVVLAAPATVALAMAASSMRSGIGAAERALDGVSARNTTSAGAAFDDAGRHFGDADRGLRGPLVSLGLGIPGLASNLRASRTLAAVGQDLSLAGGRAAAVLDGRTVDVASGSVPVDELARLEETLSDGADVLGRAHDRLAAIARPFLVPPLHQAVREMDFRLERGTTRLRRAATGVGLARAALGADGPRRYVVALRSHPASPAAAGTISGWAHLVTDGGKVRLEPAGDRQGPGPVSALPGVDLFPDLAAGLRTLVDSYTAVAGGGAIDGAVVLDPTGLDALLDLAGPVRIAGRAEPVAAGDVAELVRTQSVAQVPGGAREAPLSQLLTATLEAVTTRDLGNARTVADSLIGAMGNRHIVLYLSRAGEERALGDLGVDGSVEPVKGDSLIVTMETSADGVTDGLSPRTVRYDVHLRPGRSAAELTSRLEMSLVDQSPGRPEDHPAQLSVYTPFAALSAAVDGRPVAVESRPELGRQVHSLRVGPAPRGSRTVTLDMGGRLVLTPDGWYRLDILRQPALPEELEISFTVPRGWRIAETHGLRRTDDRRAWTTETPVAGPVLVRLERTTAARIWDRLTSAGGN